MKYAVIPAREDQPIRFEDVEETSLELMQKEVGGLIENVRIPSRENAPGFGLYCNEEGKVDGLPPNHRATLICRLGRSIAPDDYIAGDAVVYGSVDSEGEITGLSGRQEAYLGILAVLTAA